MTQPTDSRSAARIPLLDFTRRLVRWVTLDEANKRMREQEKRGVRCSASGSTPPRRPK